MKSRSKHWCKNIPIRLSEMSKIVVFGGAGFLGRRICQAGIESGFKVTSLTRSGTPPKVTSHKDAFWVSQVDWKPANIFKPETYKHELKEATSVVHSLGILLENQNYKKVVNSNSSVINEFLGFLKPGNPLAKDSFNTYDAVNRDSAVLLAETFKEVTTTETPSFVYISADKGFPGLPQGYIQSKREAEYELEGIKDLRTIFLRPGFMYDEISNEDNVRSVIKKLVDTLDWGNNRILGNRIELLNELVRPTVSTQRVGQAAIYRIEDENFSGVVTLEDLLEKY